MVAWLLAGFCLVGHAAHWLPHAPRWLHLLGSSRFHAVASALALAGVANGLLAAASLAGCCGLFPCRSCWDVGPLQVR